jgi:hypothetical protein
MTTYIVGFDGKWQQKFSEVDDAVSWARDVADTGRTVEVIRRRFGFPKFVTAFPESERKRLEARWATGGAGMAIFPVIGGDLGGGTGGSC